ncbi:MAG TPA: TetR family transcriptional regulator [Allosphingosinicella sp.]|jgi:AcrR family transcriptional regulator|uniref:TetR/AcrR family transcriptional regulator n=1 Tax=Allosphingosinicella sp. TaxID=2823234 RepID=UPI002F283ADE
MSMQAHSQPATRLKNAAATRDAILEAARQRFLLESYDNVGLRDIAGDAGVDVALVGRYFGGKEKLFEEVLGKCEVDLVPADIGADELPAFLAKLFMDQDQAERRQHIEQLLIVLRSAGSPSAGQIVRDALRQDILGPLTERLTGDNAETRASLAMGVLMGATVIRTIMSVGPMCNDKCTFIEERLARLFEAALSPR